MDERIWALPGPRTLITDTLNEVSRGRHVCIVLPAAMAKDPSITDGLAGAVIDETNRTAMTCRIHPEAGADSLLEVLAKAVDLDDPPATVPELLGHYQAADTVFVAVAAEFSPAQQAEFPALLQRLERETHSVPRTERMSLVVIGGREHLPHFAGGESSDVSLATLWWWNRIARWDTAAYIRHIDGPRIEDRTMADVRGETIVEVARWDLSLAEDLAQEWSGDPAELPDHLRETKSGVQSETRERCGSRPADSVVDLWDAGQLDGWHDQYAPAASAQRLRRLVWAAQARNVLPWIEQRREALQDKAIEKLTRKRFNDALQQLFTPPLTDTGQVEVGHLHLIIDARLGRTEPGMRSTARRLRDARNKLAHLDTLTLAELGELVNSCRDLY